MDNEAIETTAAAWVIRRSADTWTVSDQNRLDVWLTESTSHRVAYLRLDAVWQHTVRLVGVCDKGQGFRTNNLEAFLSLLQQGVRITIQETDDRVVLKRHT